MDDLSTLPPTPPLSAPPSRSAGTLTALEFQRLLTDLVSPAYGYALRLTRNRADAEDLVQDASFRAFRSLHTFAAGTNFKAWFFRILTRAFWERHREQQRRPATVELDEAPALYLYKQLEAHDVRTSGDDPAAILLDRLGTDQVADAIARLPEEFAAVCTLYFMEDFAYHEIAEVLDCPVGTVRSRLHRGRKMLQRMLWQVAEDAGIVGDLARGGGGR